MGRKLKFYTCEDKLNYLKLFFESGMTKSAFCRAHNITNSSVLNGWIKKYQNEINPVSFLYEKIKITPVFMAPLLSLWC